ncbi:acyl-CoA synthetase [Pseudomonas sp. MAFF 301449]|uniref:Acyl-CoA synthetase n=1 Tax=Pseudomonas cyclaminis TaxID=2781239 RepID=A0ABR9SPV4_9PSED|nr:acyl-CoA synthetase [Pseudomonas cyclaminis]MBE8590936.1 acyl-CoA synthetase [Pseudomonas cyclaminis]MBE8598627.1 acyl-CoA synthetase [Pseudomonas cyclaminis]
MAVKNFAEVDVLESRSLVEHDLAPSTYEAIKRVAERTPLAPALSFFLDAEDFSSTFTWNYAELFTDITRAANVFYELGITPDDVIAFVLPNLPETHFTIWGGEAAGIVMAVNPLLEASQIADLLRAAGVKLLVTLAPQPGSNLWTNLERQFESLPELRHVVWVRMESYNSPSNSSVLDKMAFDAKSSCERVFIYNDLRALMKDQPYSYLRSGRLIRPDDRSSYFCTGGTTGLPKIATRTHRSEIFNAWAMANHLKPRDSGQVIFCGLPLFHVNGQLVTGLMPWTQGDHVILGTPQGYRGAGVIARFWALVQHFRINFFSGVPTFYAALLEQDSTGFDLSSLNFAFCGAAPMPIALFREFERRTGVRILEGYGLTEGACVSSLNPPGGERRIGSIGLSLAHQGMRVVVLDPLGEYQRDASVEEVGVIVIRGLNVFDGYLDENHNQGIWIEIGGQRWLNTGDLGRQDTQGYFWLTGRKKELIIRSGHNIDPKQIEEVLQAHPAVSLAAAIGSPDAYAGEVPVAYVQLCAGQTCSEKELLAFASLHISERAAVPKRIVLIETLPLTTVGKIYKPALQQREISQVVMREAESIFVDDVTVEVIQDNRRGMVAVVFAGDSRARLETLLGRYNFQVEWAE